MKRTITTFLILSAFAFLLASCGKLPMVGSGNGRTIKVKVTGVETKVSPTTTSTLTSFKLSAYATAEYREIQQGPSDPKYSAGIYIDPKSASTLKDIVVSGSNSTGWTITGNSNANSPTFSWINAIEMRFFAYAPATTATNGTLTIKKLDASYDAAYPFEYSAKATSDEVTSTNCDDIIFAYEHNTAEFEDDATDSNYGKLVNNSKDYINLTFHHALAQIRFCVDPDEWGDLKLLYVKLYGPKSTSDPSQYVGLYTKGSCTFDSTASKMFTWSSLANRYAYSQTFNGTTGVSFSSGLPTGGAWESITYGTGATAKTFYTCTGDVLLVVPQGDNYCAVEVCIQDGTSTPVVMKGHLPVTGETGTLVYWDPDMYYTYKIGTTGSRDELGLSMTLVDWDERESYIPIG